MLPADAPDFFERPAPEGRSRESRIRLDLQGQFWHDGARVENLRMRHAFATWIERHPANGRFILNNGYDWGYFTVEDAPFFVERIDAQAGAPLLVLSDGSTQALALSEVWIGQNDVVYVSQHGSAFTAKFTRDAQLQLEPWLEELTTGEIGLALNGELKAIPRRAP